MPQIKQNSYSGISENLDLTNLHFLDRLKKSEIGNYIDQNMLYEASYQKKLHTLKYISMDGFEHGDLSSQYVYFQNDLRYKSARYFGWILLFKIINSVQKPYINQKQFFIDFLAGSGTLSQRSKQLYTTNCPIVVGIDISKRMSKMAYEKGEIVFWGSYNCHIIKNNVADLAIAAHGFHHVPENQHPAFVLSMKNSLKHNGICLLQDYEEDSSTAKFYSQCVNKYRPGGHPTLSFTKESITKLMQPHFEEIKVHYLYDPFYLEGLEGQDEYSLKKECYSYLISLYNLRKLVPTSVDIKDLFSYNDRNYWNKIENILFPFFKFGSESEKIQKSLADYNIDSQNLKKLDVPFVEEPTIKELSDGRLSIIVPRSGIVCLGSKK